MIYILAFFVPPLALLLNGQLFAAVLNFVLIVPCLFFGLIFHVLLAGAVGARHHRDLSRARKPQAPRDRRGHSRARSAAGLAGLEAPAPATTRPAQGPCYRLSSPAASSALLITAPISIRGGAALAFAGISASSVSISPCKIRGSVSAERLAGSRGTGTAASGPDRMTWRAPRPGSARKTWRCETTTRFRPQARTARTRRTRIRRRRWRAACHEPCA